MLEKAIAEKLGEIAEYLLDYDVDQLATVGFKYGKLSVALFNLLYYNYSKDPRFMEKGDVLVHKLVREVLVDGIPPGARMRESLIDFGIFLELINKYDLFEVSTNEILNDLDQTMIVTARELLANKNIDIINGGLNVAEYFIWRNHSTPTAKAYLEEILCALESAAYRDEAGRIYWKSITYDEQVFTGILGSSAVICYALKMIEMEINPEVAKKLIRDTADFILAHQEYNPAYFFTVTIGEPAEGLYPLKWLYGDLVPAYALYRAGDVCGEEDWKTLAMAAYDAAAGRLDEPKVILDAGFAHGIAGTALMFYKMNALTGKSLYKTTLHQCYQKSIERYYRPDIETKYQAYYRVEGTGDSIGFISGIVGVGLSYLAFLDQRFQFYERLLFI